MGAMVIVDGKGEGQVRFTKRQVNSTFMLDRPFTVPPDGDSLVTVLPWRSHFTLAGNTFVRGTTVQLFGAAWHAVFADNVAEDLTRSGRALKPNHGFSAWGRSYGPGIQPCMYVQFTRNVLSHSGFCRTTSFDDDLTPPKPYLGAGYNRGHVHSRNMLIATNLTIEGSATDIVVEGNVGSADSIIQVTNVSGLHPPVHVTVRGNDMPSEDR